MNELFLNFWQARFPLLPSLNFASSPAAPVDAGGAAPSEPAATDLGGSDEIPTNDADQPSEPVEDAPATEPADGTEPEATEEEPEQPAIPAATVEEEEITDASLADTYKSLPSLKPILKAHPELRAPFFKAVEINKIFRTVDDAKIAREWAGQLASFDKHYFAAGASNKRELMKQLWENSLDKEGKSTGHYEELAQTFVEDSLTNFARSVAQDPSWAARAGLTQEQARAAVHFTCRMLGIGLKDAAKPTAAPKPGEQPQPNRWVKEEDPEWQQWNTERQKGAETANQEFMGNVSHDFWSTVDTKISDSIKETLPAIQKINPMLAEIIPDKIKSLIHDALSGDELFEARIESMWRSGGRNPETAKKILAELDSRLRQELPTAVRAVLQKAGISTVAAARAKQARTDAGASRREPAIAAGAPGRTERPKPAAVKPTGDYNKDANRILGID